MPSQIGCLSYVPEYFADTLDGAFFIELFENECGSNEIEHSEDARNYNVFQMDIENSDEIVSNRSANWGMSLKNDGRLD